VKASTELAENLVSFVRTSVLKPPKGNKSPVDPRKNIALLSDKEPILSEVREWIPSMFPDLDRILGGGWPVGRASEVFGMEGKGKSALSHMAIKGVQSIGGTAMLLDFEHALDPDKLDQLGIDRKRLIYVVPDHIEQAWDIIWDVHSKLMSSPPPAPFLFVWDSVAASVPKKELEASAEDSSVALIARAMSKGCRKMYKAIARVRAHMMWINQLRTKVGAKSFFGPVMETVGGVAIRYASSIRVNCKYTKQRSHQVKGEKVVTGLDVHTTTAKNRLAPPYQQTAWVIDFERGQSPEITMFDQLVQAKAIKVCGGGYYSASWSETKFRKNEFVDSMKDKTFRKGAETTLKGVLDGTLTFVKATTDDEEAE
jgi:recombination protein RecA